jgi:BP28CT (NUC211) domain
MLKGLFVPYFSSLIRPSVEVLLDHDGTLGGSKSASREMSGFVMQALHKCFLYDSAQNFVSKERFDLMLKPLISQLSCLAGETSIEHELRARTGIIPSYGPGPFRSLKFTRQ